MLQKLMKYKYVLGFLTQEALQGALKYFHKGAKPLQISNYIKEQSIIINNIYFFLPKQL